MSDTPNVNPTSIPTPAPVTPTVPAPTAATAPAPSTPAATAPATTPEKPPVVPKMEVSVIKTNITALDAEKMKTKFIFTQTEREHFGAYALLSEVVRQAGGLNLPVAPYTGDEKAISTLVDLLFIEGLIEIAGLNYKVTEKGYQKIKVFNDRYNEIFFGHGAFRFYDIAADQFAHEDYPQLYSDPAAWEAYTYQTYPKVNPNDPDELRFRNLIVAVLQYENYCRKLANQPVLIDIKEAMFYLVLGEQYFTKSFENKTFALDLATGSIFDELQENLNSQLQLIQFQVMLGEEQISPKAFFDSIIDRGKNLLTRAIEEIDNREAEQASQNEPVTSQVAGSASAPVEEVVTTTTTTTYVDDYDPWCVVLWPSPFYYEPLVVIDYW